MTLNTPKSLSIGSRQALSLCIGFSALLAGCHSTPDIADMQPLLDEAFTCPLWVLSNAKKTDGIKQDNGYQMDYAFDLTLKDSPQETVKTYLANEHVPPYNKCEAPITQMLYAMAADGKKTLEPAYVVTGSVIFVKSEKGWQMVNANRASYAPK